jgi:hypothetical protein
MAGRESNNRKKPAPAAIKLSGKLKKSYKERFIAYGF